MLYKNLNVWSGAEENIFFHIHLCLDPSEKDPMKQESNKEKLRASMISRAESMVKAGITTARDLGGGRHQELLIRDLIKKKN